MFSSSKDNPWQKMSSARFTLAQARGVNHIDTQLFDAQIAEHFNTGVDPEITAYRVQDAMQKAGWTWSSEFGHYAKR